LDHKQYNSAHTKNNWHINKFAIINGPTATQYLHESDKFHIKNWYFTYNAISEKAFKLNNIKLPATLF